MTKKDQLKNNIMSNKMAVNDKMKRDADLVKQEKRDRGAAEREPQLLQ